MRHGLDGLALAVAAAAAGLIAGCVAPMGIGPGPVQIPAGKGVVSGGAGFGAAASREQFQAEASGRFQVMSALSLEGGLVYGTLRDRDGDRQVVLSSAMPYVRPALHVRGASLGVALSGLGAGGGGGGAAWGLIEPRLGYGRETWSVYAAWLRHGASVVGGSSTSVSSQHWRLAGDRYFDVGGVRLGVAAVVTRGDDRISYSPGEGSSEVGGRWDGPYTMGTVNLSVMSRAF